MNSVVKTAVEERRQDVLDPLGEAKYSSEEFNRAMLKKRIASCEKEASVNRYEAASFRRLVGWLAA